VSFASGSKTSLQINAAVELNSSLDTGGASLPVATVNGQNKRFIASLTAGDDVGLALRGLTLTPSSPSYVVFDVRRPNGQSLVNGGQYCYASTSPGCGFSLRNVPDTGTYQVHVELQGSTNASYSLTLSHDVTGTLTVGSPLNVNLDVPGRHGWLSFTTTATQTMALGMSSIATTPSGKSVAMSVYNASGSQVASTSGTSTATLNLTNLAAGTYSVLLIPSNTSLATMNVTLVNGLGGTLPTDGTSQTFSTAVAGQHGYFTFSANAGDDLGFALTGLTLTPSSPTNVVIDVKRPTGQSLLSGGQYCYASSSPGCVYSFRSVPDTGTYQVYVELQGLQNASYTLTVSHNVTGTLTPGSPLAVNLDVPGRQGWLSFTTEAIQTMVLNASSIVTTPSGKAVWMYVYNASGTQVGSTSGTSSATLNLPNLAAGTYDVLLRPNNAALATMSVTLADGIGGLLPTDGTSQSYSSAFAGQNGYFTFQANAGDDLGLALTSISLVPASNSYVTYLTYYRPNGTQISSFYCYPTSVPGCGATMLNAPDTGTYTLVVEPPGNYRGNYTLTLSHAVTGTLTSGAAPLLVDLTAHGRRGYLSYAATAGQSLTLNLSSIATTPAGKQITARVYNPSGTQIGSVSGTSSATLNLSNLTAGTHMVFIFVANEASGTVQVSIP
jgi:hypothetical protein